MIPPLKKIIFFTPPKKIIPPNFFSLPVARHLCERPALAVCIMG